MRQPGHNCEEKTSSGTSRKAVASAAVVVVIVTGRQAGPHYQTSGRRKIKLNCERNAERKRESHLGRKRRRTYVKIDFDSHGLDGEIETLAHFKIHLSLQLSISSFCTEKKIIET